MNALFVLNGSLVVCSALVGGVYRIAVGATNDHDGLTVAGVIVVGMAAGKGRT